MPACFPIQVQRGHEDDRMRTKWFWRRWVKNKGRNFKPRLLFKMMPSSLPEKNLETNLTRNSLKRLWTSKLCTDPLKGGLKLKWESESSHSYTRYTFLSLKQWSFIGLWNYFGLVIDAGHWNDGVALLGGAPLKLRKPQKSISEFRLHPTGETHQRDWNPWPSFLMSATTKQLQTSITNTSRKLRRLRSYF